MKPERWSKIESIFHKALEADESRRGAVIEESCAGDAELRREVESLLAHHSDSASFIEKPAFADQVNTNRALSAPTAAAPRPDLKGVAVGHYRILEEIGFGGMGVVYKAEDSRLGRLVALKFLPEHMAADSVALERFRREARSASSLNHPNICTIYDIDVYQGREFIVMEYLDGQTLAVYITGRRAVSTELVAKLGMPIAEALAAAHSKGIIHRDIKPGNIFVTQSGLVKVLDFGVAKLVQESDNTAVTTVTEANTITGTLPYMSPEQLRGENLDARSDIYALGVVLYEIATGQRPYSSSVHGTLVDEILNRQASAPSSINRELSAKADDIILKCLAKDPEDRYQTAKEISVDLRHLSLRADLLRLQRESGSGKTPAVAKTKVKPANRLAIYAVSIALIAAAALTVYLFRSQSSSMRMNPAEWTPITDFSDSVVSPALSPDGRILAFLRGDDTFFGKGEIYAKLLPDGEPVRLTHDGVAKMSPHFSLDGSRIYYTEVSNNWDIWMVPVLGGEPRLILGNAEGLSWIGEHSILFSETKSGLHMALETANEDRTGVRDIYIPPRERGMAHRSALSPDRKSVLLTEMDNGGWLPCRLLPFDGSSVGQPVGPPEAECVDVAWSPDGKWMYFSANPGGRFHIWREPYPAGELQQVTSGATEEEGIAMAPDGDSLITSVGTAQKAVMLHDAQGERQISSESYAEFATFSHDGKKVFYMVPERTPAGQAVKGEQLFSVDLATGQSERVLAGALMTGYSTSPDGKKVVYSAVDKNQHPHLWRADLDLHSSPQQFMSPSDEDSPQFGADGFIYFRAAEGGRNFLYRMKQDGSGRSKVLQESINEVGGISPDGKWAVVSARPAKTGSLDFRTVIVPLEGGEPVTVCATVCYAFWTDWGNQFAVYLIQNAGYKTVFLPIPPGKVLPLLPEGGIERAKPESLGKGARVLDGVAVLGPHGGEYVSLRDSVHRNLYRIPLK
ncbi:MAG: protein kinase [Candidatus Sulfotelmatobacter sp.]